MTIKTYVCPDIHCQRCAERVQAALQNAPVQGIEIDPEQHTVRVGLLDEGDDKLIQQCLSDAGYPPREVLAEPS